MPDDHLVEAEHLPRHELLPAETQKLPGQVHGPLGRLADLVGIGPPGIVPLQRGQQEIAESHDDHHHVVEVVGHPARQPSDRLHLLGLPNLLLGPPPLGEVLHVDRVADHLALGILDRRGVDQRGEDARRCGAPAPSPRSGGPARRRPASIRGNSSRWPGAGDRPSVCREALRPSSRACARTPGSRFRWSGHRRSRSPRPTRHARRSAPTAAAPGRPPRAWLTSRPTPTMPATSPPGPVQWGQGRLHVTMAAGSAASSRR